MKAIGLDGYKKGWVAVTISNKSNGIKFLTSVSDLQKEAFDLAMIDIPIGLPENGSRQCDVLGKKLLGVGASRVFTGARRDYWTFKSMADANHHYWSRGDTGISAQLWCLRQKIAEVDEFVTPATQESVRETHPELAFWRLNGCTLLPPKKTREGIQTRLTLLRANGISEIDEWVGKTRLGTGAKADDVLDASVAALVALKPMNPIPQEPHHDSRGLRMEICY
jgi:predicted RNase H-like nuclease